MPSDAGQETAKLPCYWAAQPSSTIVARIGHELWIIVVATDLSAAIEKPAGVEAYKAYSARGPSPVELPRCPPHRRVQWPRIERRPLSYFEGLRV